MTPEERDQLIQRFYDGETIGREAEVAERLLEEDPQARQLLEGLRTLSDSIRIDIAEAVADEDFSGFWGDVQQRLPKGPLTLEQGQDREGVVAQPSRPLEAKRRPWLRWIFAPAALAGAAAAVLLMTGPPATAPEQPLAVADHSIVIDALESAGGNVMVQQEHDDLPAIIWFTESESSEG